MVHFWDCGVVFGVVSERKPKIKGICRGAVIGAKKGGTKMSRLVLKMPYVKGGGHASNNVKYIATREGVDKSINFNINGQHKKNNIEYIATRPRAVRVANHGLFGNEDEVNLNKVKTEVANHTGNIWQGIISLRREDAERTGYDNPIAWRTLLRSKQLELAKNLKIPVENFRWYAAFHDEKHHPHVHIVMYSANPGREYLSKKGIEIA